MFGVLARGYGGLSRQRLELLTATARLWQSLGHYDVLGGFRIDGVTGPDEYSAIADNNIFTNLMAQRNLLAAADLAEQHSESSLALGVGAVEIAGWRRAAATMVIPFDEVRGVHSQSEGFTDHEVWDFASTPPEGYPLLLHFPYFELYRKQVVKQADLVLAMFLRGDAFSLEQKRKNFDYYEQLTVRDSSLSACCQAVIAAEVGHMALAYDYLAEAALMDLRDLEHNTRDGLHVASLAGTWIALVAGLGGMRTTPETLAFAPRLPDGISRLAFNVEFRGRRLHVERTRTATSYVLRRGDNIEFLHHGEPFEVATGRPTVFAEVDSDDATTPQPSPSQPYGRAPRHRVAGDAGEPEEAS